MVITPSSVYEHIPIFKHTVVKNNEKCDLLWNKGYGPFEKYLRFTDTITPHLYLTYITSLFTYFNPGRTSVTITR